MSTTDAADEQALEARASRPRGGAVPAIVAMVLVVVPWMVVGAESLAAAFAHLADPAALRTQDIAALLPLLCLALSVCAVLGGGPSDKPRLEPSMLAAVPGMGGAVALLCLGLPRFGFGFWDLRLDVWALSVAALASIMLVAGVRHPLRYGVWAMWLLAFPMVSMWLAEAWSQAARAVADLVGATGARPTVVQDVDGFALLLLLVGLLTLRVDIARGRRLRITALLVAATFATSEARDALYVALGRGAQLPATLVRTAVIVAIAGVLVHYLAPSRGIDVTRRQWRRHLRARPTWVPKYVAVAGTWYLAMLALATLATHDPGFRGGVQALRDLDRLPRARFAAGVDPASIGLPLRRDGIDGPQRPEPWPRLQLPVAGYESCAQRRVPWYLDVFDDAPVLVPFAMRERTDRWQPPLVGDAGLVWALVLPTRNRTLANQLQPTNQFEAHLARIYRVRQVQVQGGAVTLMYQSHHGHDFASAHFTQSVTLPGGRPSYRTVVVAATATGGRDASVRHPATRFARITYGTIDRVRQQPDRAPSDADFRAAADRVLAAVDAITSEATAGLAHPEGSQRSGSTDCSMRIAYGVTPRVRRIR